MLNGSEASAYVTDADDDTTSSEAFVDRSEPNWRENLRNVVIATHTQSVVIEIDDVGEDGSAEEFDQPLKVPSVTSINGARLRLDQ